jgi:hypothetical protein
MFGGLSLYESCGIVIFMVFANLYEGRQVPAQPKLGSL